MITGSLAATANVAVDVVRATGPEAGSSLEDRVEVSWTLTTPIATTSRITIRRDGTLLGMAASTEVTFDDLTAVPATSYQYCIGIRAADGTETPIGCDNGGRLITPPSRFDASDGLFEELVQLSWTDHSGIESGYNIYRDGGYALMLDGVDDYVSTASTEILGSFTFEFWARRASAGTPDFVLNIESPALGDPVRQDLEIGFTADDRFSVGFGTNLLTTPTAFRDLEWHHWAVVYDAPTGRRFIYRDGEMILSDILAGTYGSAGILEFGRRRKAGNATTRAHFHGQLDEIRLWTRALTPNDVGAAMNSLIRPNTTNLRSYWPLDAQSGLVAHDVVGSLRGTLQNMPGTAWTASGAPPRYARTAADITSFQDGSAVPGFEYSYRVAAFVDVNGDGRFTATPDYESEQRTDPGWRALISPPGNVAASDGQFLDRVRITWADRSSAEEGFRIYRDNNLIGTVAANATTFDDVTPVALQDYEYCVASFAIGNESIHVCDDGRAGGLAAPTDVAATSGEFDDRVRVTWAADNGGRDGFEVFRGGSLIGTTAAAGREFIDRAAVPGIEYDYCVRAFSDADLLARSYSDEACTVTKGLRAAVLAATDLTVSQNDFENRVDLRWTNPSTSAMLFLVEREGDLIEILDHSRTFTTDFQLPSDEDTEYCVIAATVLNQNQAASKATVTQVLMDFRTKDAVAVSSGLETSTADSRKAAVYAALGLELTAGKAAASAFEDGYAESTPTCESGSRSINAPTGLASTLDDHESHVRLEWVDNSQVETGYRIYRAIGSGTPETIATLSPNRTTYSDFTGAPGQTYVYTLEAFDDFGVSKTASVQGRRTLKPPTQFTASDGTSETTVRLSWKDNSAAEQGYVILRQPADGTGTRSEIGRAGKNETAFNDVLDAQDRGIPFKYWVAAFDQYGTSLEATANGRTFILSPANVNASTVYADRIVVVWVDRSAVESNYVITRRRVGSASPEAPIQLAANATSYIDTGADLGVEYQYCVRARLASNGSEFLSPLSPGTCNDGVRSTGGIAGGGNGGDPVDDGAIRITSPLPSVRVGDLSFGQSVALEGDLALVGIPGADEYGKAGFFDAANLTATSTPLQVLEPGAGTNFGFSVDYSGDYAVVGQPARDNSAGGAFHLFERTGATWDLLSPTGGIGFAGSSVGIASRFVIVGSKNFSGAQTRQGAALVCDIEDDDECASPVRLDSLITPVADGEFGAAAAITRLVDVDAGEDVLLALVGAPGQIAAFMFECDLTASDCLEKDDWALTDADGFPPPFTDGGPNRRFGAAVALDGPIAVIGDPYSGGVVVYERTAPGSWAERPPLRPKRTDFGAALAIEGTTIVVGSPADKVGDRENAGTIVVYQWSSPSLTEIAQYDATVSALPSPNGRFGAAVSISGGDILVGAPGEGGGGGVYLIPDGLEPPDRPIIPIEVTLTAPTDVRASDGTAPDRIQVRWSDNAENEAGHVIFRSIPGGDFERVGEVSEDVEFYDDFAASPGEAYTYCVASFSLGPYLESDRACDIGWRPPNGTIAGRVFSRGGAGTEDALVCLDPSVNRGLLLDGVGGHVLAPILRDTNDESRLDMESNFTIEMWIRPRSLSGQRSLIVRPQGFHLFLENDKLHFNVEETGGTGEYSTDATLSTGTWHHVAVVKAADNNILFYLDGDTLEEVTVTPLARFDEAADSLWIGQSGDGDAFFEGEIDEVRIWSVERTEEQIDESRFQALTGREESLVGYWPLDEGLRRVVPDLTRSANHGSLFAGTYVTDKGAELNVCGLTGSDGNFSISRIRYGETTKFEVVPTREGREFSPRFKEITLSIDSPVQNEVFFSDITAYTVAGIVAYRDEVEDVNGDTVVLTCPVPDVAIHVDKGSLPSDDNLKIVTEADGSYAVSVDPSVDASDTWFIIPRGPSSANESHSFNPVNRELEVTEDIFGVDFFSQKRNVLAGYVSGGDPTSCGKNIGKAEVRVYTQDGCYDHTFIVDTGVNNGRFSLNLPPLEYLVEVTPVEPAPGATPEFIADVDQFFERLGAVEVDLRTGDADRNLTYRAPIDLRIAGLEPLVCSSGFAVNDSDGNPLRSLPSVRIIPEFDFVPLQFLVTEEYADGDVCQVGDGTVTIFDAIADRVDADSTMTLVDGVVEYSTFGASPNVFSGARVGGIDRSFQKPITVVAQVEGRPAMMETQWAIVEGFRERAATFVSATTEQLPLMILHDPPGSNSVAFIEKDVTRCTRISNLHTVGGGAGALIDIALGFKADIGFSFGAHTATEGGGGFLVRTRTVAGRENTSLDGENIEICATTTDAWQTSDDAGWVGEDVVMGVALNLIFALADQISANEAQCTVDLSEILATDIDNEEPFETVYAYGRSHIEHSLIPQLENLVRLGGDATLSGPIEGVQSQVRLVESIQNWQRHLRLIDQNKADAINVKNYSFSGGVDVSRTEAADTTRVTHLESSRIYVNSDNALGAVFTVGYDQVLAVAFEVNAEWVSENEGTTGNSQTIGYTLSDGDGGDYFSVDVGKDPRFGTFAFNTMAGRSSNPCEDNTQCRDNPMITVDPPIRHNVNPGQAASFQLTLINASESNERRRYVIAVPPEKNPNNLGIHVAGGALTGTREYVLDPGKALTVNLDAYASPSAYSYERVGVMMYPPDEWPIWGGDPRFPFERSDTTFFSVHFDSTRGGMLMAQMTGGWNWFSINSEGGDLASTIGGVPAVHGDILRSQSAESRYDSTSGWVGGVTRLNPGLGYRIKLKNPTVMRVVGEPYEATDPMGLKPGWTWIGYLPTRALNLDDALASLSDRVMEGDLVVGLNSFAQYVKGAGWVGTLRDMQPGESYAIHMDGGGELLYPAADEPSAPREPYVRETTLRGPEWIVDAGEHDASMTIVAEIQHLGAPLRQTTTKVAAYVGEEIRGTGEVHYVEALDRYLAFIMIYGGMDEETPVMLHVFDGEKDRLYEDVAKVSYAAQSRIGQPAGPVVIDLANAGQAPELSDLPETFALHPNFPNPFNTYTIIPYDLPEASHVRIEVYDILGRRISTLVDAEHQAGRHRFVLNNGTMASGVYFYRMEIGDALFSGKMVLVR